MALVDIKQLRCPKCGSTNHIHVYKNINAQEDFKLRDKILSGQLFDFYCPYCEYRARLYYPCLYNDVKNKFMVYFIPGIEKGQMIDRAVDMEFQDMPFNLVFGQEPTEKQVDWLEERRLMTESMTKQEAWVIINNAVKKAQIENERRRQAARESYIREQFDRMLDADDIVGQCGGCIDDEVDWTY